MVGEQVGKLVQLSIFFIEGYILNQKLKVQLRSKVNYFIIVQLLLV